jgi:hypothetical protein
MLSIVSDGMVVLPPFNWGVTSTGSHLIGAYAFRQQIKLQPLVSYPYLSSRKDILYGL